MNRRMLFLIGFGFTGSLIAYYDLKKCHHLPWPPRFIFTALTFTVIYITAMFNEEVAGVSAIGFAIAMFLKQGFVSDCNNGQSTSQPQTTAFMTGPGVPPAGNTWVPGTAAGTQPPGYGIVANTNVTGGV